MPQYVALLRGINLGRRRVKMDRLARLFVKLSLDDVATVLASGNVVFSTRRQSPAVLERKIAAHLNEALGYEVDTFVRSQAEMASLAALCPFRPDLVAAAHAVHVLFFHQPLAPSVAKAVQACRTKTDEFHAAGRELFWLTRASMSETTVWKQPLMKQLWLASTMRNVATVERLVDKFEQSTAARRATK